MHSYKRLKFPEPLYTPFPYKFVGLLGVGRGNEREIILMCTTKEGIRRHIQAEEKNPKRCWQSRRNILGVPLLTSLLFPPRLTLISPLFEAFIITLQNVGRAHAHARHCTNSFVAHSDSVGGYCYCQLLSTDKEHRVRKGLLNIPQLLCDEIRVQIQFCSDTCVSPGLKERSHPEPGRP
jgi:hypothetical protein